jgi:hypothetical protein
LCVLVASIGVALMLVSTTSVGASVATKSSKFCKAVASFDAQALGSPTMSSSEASSAIRQLERMKRVASGQAKQALGPVITAYEQVADGKRAEKVFARAKVAKATSQLSLAVGLCTPIELPDDITLPSTTRPSR